MVLSTSEKLASLNPAVRREGQRELQQQTTTQASRTVSRAKEIAGAGFAGTVTPGVIEKEIFAVVPKKYWGTTSIEHGQVSPTGKVEFTSEQLAAGRGGAVRREPTPTRVQKVVEEIKEPVPKEYWGTTSIEFGQVSPTGEVEFTPGRLATVRRGAITEPTPLYTQFTKLTPKEKLRKAELEEMGEFRKIGFAGFRGFESIAISTATGLVSFGKSVAKGVVKEFIDIQLYKEEYKEERGSPFTDIFKGTFVEPALKKVELPFFKEYIPEKPILLKVGEGIKPAAEFVYQFPKETAMIGFGVAGAVGREILRKPVTTTLEFAAFAGLGRLPKAVKAAKETALLRARYSLRAGKIQLGEIKPTPTPTFPFKQVKGEFIFGKAGEIVGRQTQLREADIVKSLITSPQAEFRKPLLAEAKAAKELDQYLGKWLTRPLSPEEVAITRRFEGNILADKVKFQTEFVPRFEGEYLGGKLSFRPELKPPEEVFPVKISKLKKIWPKGKRAELELISKTILKEDPFAKFETDFFTRIPKPKAAITEQLRFVEAPRTRLGVSSALALAQRPAQLPKQMLKQIQVALPGFEQMFMPVTEQKFDVDIMPRQKLREEIIPKQIVIPKLRTELLLGGAPTPTDFEYPRIDVPEILKPTELKFPFLVSPPRLKKVKTKEAREFARMFQPSPTLIGIEQRIFGKGFKFATGFEAVRPIPLM